VVFPLPPKWRGVLVQNGFQLALLISTVLWYVLILRQLLFGVYSVGKMFVLGCKDMLQGSRADLGVHVFFDGLSAKNIPISSSCGGSHEIISWYQQWPGRVQQLDSICHAVKVADQYTIQGVTLRSLKSEVPLPTTAAALFRFLAWGISASALSVVDLLRGRWWHAFILSEACKAVLVRIARADQLAQDYLFHNSSPIYRPLWTYETCAKGSRLLFYFYSTNIEAFRRYCTDVPRIYFGYLAMSWPHYLVWDKYQADFIHKVALKGVAVDVVGPIWFCGSATAIAVLPPKAVAVFDVQPVRDLLYNTYAIEFDYYTPLTVNKFLMDIQLVFSDFKYTLVLKRKRHGGNMIHPAYRSVINKIKQSPYWIEIDPDFSATELIRNTELVVSLPFTSTALLGREWGKPSIYYDPHGLLQKNDPAAHGIEIISGQEELRSWFYSIQEALNC